MTAAAPDRSSRRGACGERLPRPAPRPPPLDLEAQPQISRSTVGRTTHIAGSLFRADCSGRLLRPTASYASAGFWLCRSVARLRHQRGLERPVTAFHDGGPHLGLRLVWCSGPHPNRCITFELLVAGRRNSSATSTKRKIGARCREKLERSLERPTITALGVVRRGDENERGSTITFSTVWRSIRANARAFVCRLSRVRASAVDRSYVYSTTVLHVAGPSRFDPLDFCTV